MIKIFALDMRWARHWCPIMVINSDKMERFRSSCRTVDFYLWTSWRVSKLTFMYLFAFMSV